MLKSVNELYVIVQDDRCVDWAFGAMQRYQLNEQAQLKLSQKILLKKNNVRFCFFLFLEQ